jgi:hypothetical protein
MARELKLQVTASGAAVAGREIEGFGRKVDEVGDQAEQAKRRLEALGRAIEMTAAKSKLLARNFTETGNTSFMKEFGKNESALSGLKRMEKALSRVNDEAKKFEQFKAPDFGGIEGFATSPMSGLAHPAVIGAALGMGGGAAATATLGAVGLGGVAGGAALAAANSDQVRKAFGNLGSVISSQAQEAAAAFEGPLVKAADVVGDEWLKLRPRLTSIFSNLAPELLPLTRGLTGLFDKAMPGIEHAVQASKPLLDAIARNLPVIGHGVGQFLDAIAKAGPDAAKFFDDFAHFLDGALGVLGAVIEKGAKFYGFISGLAHLVMPKETKTVFDDTADSVDRLAEVEKKAADAARDANRAFTDQFNVLMSVDQASLGVDQALLDLKQSFKDNGKTIDEHTQKGINNRQSIDALISAYEQQRQAAIDMAGGENASKDAIDAANAKFKAQIDALVPLLKSLGLTQAQIDAVLSSWLNLAKTPDITKKIHVISEGGAIGTPLVGGRGISAFAEGGPVPGPKGAPQLILAHGGEYVVPTSGATLARSGGSSAVGSQVTVSIAPGSDVGFMRELLRALRFEVRSQGGQAAVLGIKS